MAVPNMIVTLAMNATKYAQGLRKAAKDTNSFGQFTTKAFNIAKGALVGLTLAALRYIPVIANMGAESRKADIQLRFMLENMQGISAATDKTIKRMAKFADTVSRATGIDDEQVKAVQRKLLVFKTLRQTADELGGTFDRTTQAAIDLAAAGFGSMETNAVKLGRVLQDPVRNLNALNRAGITFTDVEKRKITALQESGDLLGAQAIVLKSVENRVKGVAEASATPFEKMLQQFNQIGDSIGEAMLPALEDMNKEVSEWLATPQGRKDVEAIADAFVAASYGVRDMAKFLKEVKGFLDGITRFNMDWVQALADFQQGVIDAVAPDSPNSSKNNSSSSSSSSGSPVVADRAEGAVVVNFYAPVDSVSAGREVSRVLADYQRANGMR